MLDFKFLILNAKENEEEFLTSKGANEREKEEFRRTECSRSFSD